MPLHCEDYGSKPRDNNFSYNMYDNEDGEGWSCHGQHDTLGDSRSMHMATLSRDIVSYVESCFFLEVPIDSVCKMHIKKHVDMDSTTRDRDLFLWKKYVVNMYNRLMNRNY